MKIQNTGLFLQHKWVDLKNILLASHALPSQTRKERKLYRQILRENSYHDPMHVLEWGAGMSTIYFSKYLADLRVNYEWHAIDNDPRWHGRITHWVNHLAMGGRVKVHLREPVDEYVNLPESLGMFNIILIDGRFRRRCLGVAKRVLRTGGIVILHDAQRQHYHCGMAGYGKQQFFDGGKWYPTQNPRSMVWIGSDPDNENAYLRTCFDSAEV